MIKYFFVEDLFGIKGNTKELNFFDDINILVGKNGVGKTTILNMITAILQENYKKLFKYTFRRIKINFDDKEVTINNNSAHLNIDVMFIGIKKESPITFSVSNSESYRVSEESYSYSNELKREKRKYGHGFGAQFLYFPTYRRIETDLIDLLNNELFDHDELARYANIRRYKLSEYQGNTVLGITNDDINDLIIHEQLKLERIEKELLDKLTRKFIFSLLDPETNYRNEFADKEHDQLSRELKSLFKIANIIKDDNQLIAIDNYLGKLDNSMHLIKNSINIISSGDFDVKTLSEDLTNALNYSQSYKNIEKLLNMYRDVSNQIRFYRTPLTELEKILETYFGLTLVNIDRGVKFKKNDHLIEFKNLSAGEKQLVSLFVYSKLYRKRTMIIVDEPEIGLHVTWQRKLISQLTSNQKNVQFIFATHSPFIISGFNEKILVVGEVDGYAK